MENRKLQKIINLIRENMSVGSGGFTGASNPKGPTAGFDPVMSLSKRKKYLSLGTGSRKRWKIKKED